MQSNREIFIDVTKTLGSTFAGAVTGWVCGFITQFVVSSIAAAGAGGIFSSYNYQSNEYVGLAGVFMGSLLFAIVKNRPKHILTKLSAAIAVSAGFWHFDVML